MPNLKNLLLFVLAGDKDFLSPQETDFNYYGYPYLYQSLPQFKQSSVRAAVSQLVGDRDVDKLGSQKETAFRLTQRGKAKLLACFPNYQYKQTVWDRQWRIALIRGKGRGKKSESRTRRISKLRRVRKGLRQFGFKQYNRGVYLTPFPVSEKVREFLLGENFSGFTAVFACEQLVVGDNQQLAFDLWNLEPLLADYQDLSKRIDQLIIKIKGDNRLKEQEEKKFSLILKEYFSLLVKDPNLPRRLLIDKWPANTVYQKYRELVGLIVDRN